MVEKRVCFIGWMRSVLICVHDRKKKMISFFQMPLLLIRKHRRNALYYFFVNVIHILCIHKCGPNKFGKFQFFNRFQLSHGTSTNSLFWQFKWSDCLMFDHINKCQVSRQAFCLNVLSRCNSPSIYTILFTYVTSLFSRLMCTVKYCTLTK